MVGGLTFLALKGGQGQVTSAAMTPALPGWLVAVKGIASPLAAGFLLGYVFICLLRSAKLSLSAAVVGYAACLCFYFMRSASLDSGALDNLIAVFIVATICTGIASDFSGEPPQREQIPTWYGALGIFFLIYVLLSCILFLFGYGAFGTRFAGASYHPNAHGFLAALASGYFMVVITRRHDVRWRHAFWYFILALSIVMVVASGSRASALVTLLAAALILPIRHTFWLLVIGTIGFIAIGDSNVSNLLSSGVSRMAAAPTDNRSGVWGVLIDGFFSNPFFGVGDTSGVSGSAVLTAFGGAGIVGGAVFLAVFVPAAIRSLRLIRRYRKSKTEYLEATAAMLCVLMLAAGLFEGSLFDKFGPAPFIMMLVLNVLWLRKRRVAAEPALQ